MTDAVFHDARLRVHAAMRRGSAILAPRLIVMGAVVALASAIPATLGLVADPMATWCAAVGSIAAVLASAMILGAIGRHVVVVLAIFAAATAANAAAVMAIGLPLPFLLAGVVPAGMLAKSVGDIDDDVRDAAWRDGPVFDRSVVDLLCGRMGPHDMDLAAAAASDRSAATDAIMASCGRMPWLPDLPDFDIGNAPEPLRLRILAAVAGA